MHHHVLKQELGPRLDWKLIKTFWVSYKLNYDQLADMQHTNN